MSCESVSWDMEISFCISSAAGAVYTVRCFSSPFTLMLTYTSNQFVLEFNGFNNTKRVLPYYYNILRVLMTSQK